MAVTAAKVAVLAVGAGLGIWWLGGFGSGGVGDAAAATAAGSTDGCAQGTRDAKAGQPESLDPTADDDVQKAAKKTGNASAYLAAYASAYSDCWTKNQTKVITPAPAPKPAPAPVGTAYLNSTNALNAWLTGARQGAKDGYKDGIRGGSDYYAPGAGAVASIVPSAYRAGYACGYGTGKSYSKAFSDYPDLAPSDLPKEQENHITDSICAGQFNVWYNAHKSDASVAGGCGGECQTAKVDDSGSFVGWMKSATVAGRQVMQTARPFHVARPHPMGWPAPPMFAGGYVDSDVGALSLGGVQRYSGPGLQRPRIERPIVSSPKDPLSPVDRRTLECTLARGEANGLSIYQISQLMQLGIGLGLDGEGRRVLNWLNAVKAGNEWGLDTSSSMIKKRYVFDISASFNFGGLPSAPGGVSWAEMLNGRALTPALSLSFSKDC